MSYQYKDGHETERLKTRFLDQNDVKVWSEFLADPKCTEFFPAATFKTPVERAEFWIHKQLDRYKDRKYGLQALIDKNSGEFIGQCGLLLQEVDKRPELEVGYHILHKHWGKGYAIEAARMFKEYGLRNKQSDSIISIIHRNNSRSQNVAIKNSMKKDRETEWNGLPVYIFRTQ